ncbi:beta-mannosidase-like [Condylostylus longicornis]|uniref:beta-mannosidase-like n=1 Tax=Condylostylus longicornis TaxID=2530218 RepID=UPI00244E3246|nr:beta-mannosidase-like [Condylostylus longicornis]
MIYLECRNDYKVSTEHIKIYTNRIICARPNYSRMTEERCPDLTTLHKSAISPFDLLEIFGRKYRRIGCNILDSTPFNTIDQIGIFFKNNLKNSFTDVRFSITIETVQNIKRIGHHASIAIIAGNNENEAALVQNWYNTKPEQKRFEKEYRLLYNATINDKLRKFYNHPSRPETLTSSPSNGDKTIEDDFISQPQDPNYGDIHFYEYFRDWSDPDVYPIPRFSSEYGFQSLPQKSAWDKIMYNHDNFNDLLEHRPHLPFGNEIRSCLIFRQLPLITSDQPDYAENIIYFSQLTQALATKLETEILRKNRNSKHNTMGALYWQLNDVWIAPSWSCIDFNGNYKFLHYWAKEFMKPISIIAHSNKSTNDVEITVIRDTIEKSPLTFNIIRNTFLYNTLAPAKIYAAKTISIKPDSVLSADTFQLESNLDPKTYFYEILLKDGILLKDTIAKTYHFPQPIKKAVGLRDPNIEVEIYTSKYQAPISSISIGVKVSYPALFVYIEIVHDNITSYTLSDNGFIQTDPIKMIYLECRI